MKPVEFHRSAVREAAAAYRWYADRSERAAAWFVEELDHAVNEVSSAPERYPIYLAGTRRILFRRFPYLLVFRELADRIEVIAVAHGKRRPDYWDQRK